MRTSKSLLVITVLFFWVLWFAPLGVWATETSPLSGGMLDIGDVILTSPAGDIPTPVDTRKTPRAMVDHNIHKHKDPVSLTVFMDYLRYSNPSSPQYSTDSGEIRGGHALSEHDYTYGVGIEACRTYNKLVEAGIGVSVASSTLNHAYLSEKPDVDLNTQFTRFYLLSRLYMTKNIYVKFAVGGITAVNLSDDHYNFLYGVGVGLNLPINKYCSMLAEANIEQTTIETDHGDKISFVPIKVGVRWYF
ncbi:MAG: hypothetical protein ACYSR7_01820 [Planctomycetota bacterium]|jgi:outer membrane protein assembly factor BamA